MTHHAVTTAGCGFHNVECAIHTVYGGYKFEHPEHAAESFCLSPVVQHRHQHRPLIAPDLTESSA